MLALGRLCCFVIGKRQNTGLVGCDWKTAILVWSVVLLGGWFMAFALHTSRVLGICVLFPMKGQSPAVCFKILAIYFFLCVFLDEIICIIACYWEMLSQAYPRLILPRTRKQICFFLDKRLLTRALSANDWRSEYLPSHLLQLIRSVSVTSRASNYASSLFLVGGSV